MTEPKTIEEVLIEYRLNKLYMMDDLNPTDWEMIFLRDALSHIRRIIKEAKEEYKCTCKEEKIKVGELVCLGCQKNNAQLRYEINLLAKVGNSYNGGNKWLDY